MNKPYTTPAAFLATALLLLAPALARAQVFIETSDAGNSLASASTVLGNGAMTAITGSFSDQYDVDLFKITIASPTLFSASLVNAGTAWSLDTQLYLFDSTGHAVIGNDDADAFNLGSTIPSGSIGSLTAGTYYLAVSQSGNNPTNSAGQLLFTGYGAGTTALLTASSQATPTVLGGWTSGTYFSDSGAYQISIAGVTAVPEASTVSIMLGAAALASGLWLRRRRTVAAR